MGWKEGNGIERKYSLTPWDVHRPMEAPEANSPLSKDQDFVTWLA